MTSPKTLTSTLEQAGLRLTPQRVAICKLLAETRAHPTAAEIHAQVRAEYPSLSLMTVYNTLNSLVALGAVNAIGSAGDDNTHFDAETAPHVNLACVACHQIVDMASPQIAHLDAELTAASGYQLLGARLLYYGLCPNCQPAPVL